MRAITSRFAAASVLLAIASSAMAGATGGSITFIGQIVEPPCVASTVSSNQAAAIDMSLSCDKHSAVDVAFQRVGPNAGSAGSITLSRDGKPLGSEEATYYRMAFQGQTKLRLAASRPAADSTLSPVIMTISYL